MTAKHINDLEQRLERMSDALERAELKLEQYKKADILQKLHISQLESIVLAVRNCVTPRVMQKISAEQPPMPRDTEYGGGHD